MLPVDSLFSEVIVYIVTFPCSFIFGSFFEKINPFFFPLLEMAQKIFLFDFGQLFCQFQQFYRSRQFGILSQMSFYNANLRLNSQN
jgi:hypothetical protein